MENSLASSEAFSKHGDAWLSKKHFILISILPEQFEDIFLANMTRESGDAYYYGGPSMLYEYPFQLKVVGNNIQLIHMNVLFRADSNRPISKAVKNDFSNSISETVEQKNHTSNSFKDKLEISQLSFSYENSDTKTLDKLNLTVYPNTTVGIVGSTGSGKTTLIDLILGLLVPESGSISLDGVEINKHNISAWQNNIGYVPQSIYLTDDTIEANIAFAKSRDEINIDKAIKAAKMANLHEFITTLPEQYKTFVGERGVRLSQGQCQRIGIARALYHDPKVLVLDEATSSLDSITENAIMDAINNLSHKKTIIMIAHRLSTVKECDLIHFMSNGKIIESGTYQQLIESNEEFKRMANLL